MKMPPKPLIFLLVAVLIGAAWWFTRPDPAEARWLGYVEAESLYIAAPVAGRLAERGFERGARVSAGAELFALDSTTSDAETARVAAEVAAAQASAADLSDPRQRLPEIAAGQAGLAAAQAQAAKAASDYTRIAALHRLGFASRGQFDAAKAARDAAQALVLQSSAQVNAGQIAAGRGEQIAAAQAQVVGAQAALRGQLQRRREIAPISPAAGVIEQTFYNPGEWVPANAPVVSVLPDARRKLRFYVPQDRISALHPGSAIRFDCDGCGDTRQAKISFIAPRAEFTPPVIYSENARAKLVFLVEALLPVSEKPLPPGLPVEVLPQ